MYYFTRADVAASAFLCAKHQTTGFLCAVMIDHHRHTCQEIFLDPVDSTMRANPEAVNLSKPAPFLMSLPLQTKPWKMDNQFWPIGCRGMLISVLPSC